jgi:para-nitrobenzyl esterase
MKNSWGLYQRALMESGPIARWTSRNATVGQDQYNKLLNLTKCASSNNTLACLRQQNPIDLVKFNLSTPLGYFKTEWAPMIDGKELLDDPQVLAAQKQLVPNIQVTLGTNLNEGTLFVADFYGLFIDEAKYTKLINLEYGPVAPQVFAQYPLSQYKNPFQAFSEIFTDEGMACAARRTARWLQNVSSIAYLYQFTHEADELQIVDPGIFGVFHGSELPFVFNIPDGDYYGVPVVFAANERQLAYNIVDFWSQFAATGSPGTASGVTWPLYTAQTDQNIRLDLNLTIVQNLKQEQCDFWDSVNNQIPIGGFHYAEKMKFIEELRRESILQKKKKERK